MKKQAGKWRLAAVFTVVIALLSYHTVNWMAEPPAAGKSGQIAAAETKEPLPSVSAETKEEAAAQQAPAESKSEQAAETAAQGTVKGKVISRYLSPYQASLAYGGVTLKNSTTLAIDLKALLEEPLSFQLTAGKEPQVLIMHTHTTETYLPTDSETYTDAYTSRSRDQSKNMVSVGNIVAKKLNDAGIKTLHDTTEHDYPQYTGSYTRAAKTIVSYLKKYPSIRIVLDLHRDAISSGENDKIKLVTEIGGKKAAQVMLVMGSQSGGVTNFPKWRENLKLAVRLQQTLEKKYPTLARPISLMPKNYNESLTTGSLLIEFGTDANALAEAHASAEMVGDALAETLKKIRAQ